MKKAMLIAFYSGVISVIIGVFLSIENTGTALIINGIIVLFFGIMNVAFITAKEEDWK